MHYISESALIREMDAEELEARYRELDNDTSLTRWNKIQALKLQTLINTQYLQLTGKTLN